jgi:hypothetical protein
LLSSVFVLLLQPVGADALPLAEAATPSTDAPSETPAAPAVLLLPKGYLIQIAVDAELSSKTSIADQMFPIRLAEAVVVDGVEVLPAGITGEGQVVHAKKAGLAGAAGELVLAARYLDYNGRRIDLRSFRFMEAGSDVLSKGQDNIGVSSVTTAIAGPIGFFMQGGNTNITPGTLATAKTRNDEAFERPAAAPADTPTDLQVSTQEEMP